MLPRPWSHTTERPVTCWARLLSSPHQGLSGRIGRSQPGGAPLHRSMVLTCTPQTHQLRLESRLAFHPFCAHGCFGPPGPGVSQTCCCSALLGSFWRLARDRRAGSTGKPLGRVVSQTCCCSALPFARDRRAGSLGRAGATEGGPCGRQCPQNPRGQDDFIFHLGPLYI